jgi:hypothetical protein
MQNTFVKLQKKKKKYLQNTFSFHESSSTAASISSLTALHVSVFPWSVRVGVKVRVEKVIFPSDDTYKQAKQATLYLNPCTFSVISSQHSTKRVHSAEQVR